MRKSSVYSVRASHAGSFASQSSSAQAEAILLEKKKEHDALLALERVSNEYLRRLEAIDYDCNIMADAGRGMLFVFTVAEWTRAQVMSSSWRSAFAMAGNVQNFESFRYVRPRGFFSRFIPIFLFTYSFVLYNIVPSLNPQSKPDGEAQNNITQQNCERLVRVPIDELQERQSSKL